MSELDNNYNKRNDDTTQGQQDLSQQNTQYQNAQYQNAQYQNAQDQNVQNLNSQYQNAQNQNLQDQTSQSQNQQYTGGTNQASQYQNQQYQNAMQQNGQQGSRMPQYSFWAEQMQGNNSNYNPNTNSYEYVDPNQAKNGQAGDGKKKNKKVLKFIIRAACFGLIAGVSFFGLQYLFYKINPGALSHKSISTASGLSIDIGKKKQIKTTETGSVTSTSKSVISNVVKDAMPSIVSINSTATESNIFFGKQEVQGSGSGIIIGKNEKQLLIATNNHVVEGTNKIKVTFIDGSKAEAVIKGTDATADLAVISVDTSNMKDSSLNAIKIAKLGNSKNVKVGEMAIAIGNAMGYGQSVTVGYISAKNRTVDISDGYDTKKMVLLQTDAAINPGNSGGALLNVNGEVIGINSVKYSSTDVEGMGYAIPISRATPIINELKTREILAKDEQGYLGITGNEVTEDVAKDYNMPIGVYVYEVVKDGAAYKAGLLHGDIITGVNGIEITSMSQLKEKINSLKVGTQVKIKYKRSLDGKYKEQTVTVTLGKNPQLNNSKDDSSQQK